MSKEDKYLKLEGMPTVKDLINALKKYPQDMPVAVWSDPHDEIEIEIRTWTHDNYPYDKPDIDYVAIC